LGDLYLALVKRTIQLDTFEHRRIDGIRQSGLVVVDIPHVDSHGSKYDKEAGHKSDPEKNLPFFFTVKRAPHIGLPQ